MDKPAPPNQPVPRAAQKARNWRRPAAWLYHPAAIISAIAGFLIFGTRIRRDPAIRRLRGPLMVLSNHPSFLDPFFLVPAIWPRRVNFLTAHGYFRKRFIGGCLRKLGAIPKIQFSTDTQAMRSMLAVLHGGGNLAIYPEGQRTLDGASQPVDDAIAKLIKKEHCAVVTVVENGAYLTWPRWSKSGARPGRIEVRSRVLLTPDQINEMTVPAIQAEVEKALAFQDYDWQRNRVRRAHFRSRAPALGLHDICHRCPACGNNLAMRSSNNHLTCRFCGNRAQMNRFGLLEPASASSHIFEDARQWHCWQWEETAKLVNQPGITLDLPARLDFPTPDETVLPGCRGRIQLAEGMLHFWGDDGPDGNPPLQLHFPAGQSRGVSAKYGRYFELVQNSRIYRLTPDEGQAVILLVDAMQASWQPKLF